MITLSNKHRFEYMTASGAMGYDGNGWPHERILRLFNFIDTSLFTHVMKTVTLHPREGNFKWYKPWDCFRFIWNGFELVGTVNAYGLTNPGVNWWAETIGPKVNSLKISLVGSVFGEEGELAVMARIFNDFDLVALELDASCPNADNSMLFNSEKVIKSCKILKKISRHPILLKLSVVHDIDKILISVKDIVEAISINSAPWCVVFPDKKVPFSKYSSCGVSGKIAQPFTWSFAKRLKNVTDIPVIVPSIWNYGDIETMRAEGFKAFSFGSIFLCHPFRPTPCVKKDKMRLT